MDQVILTEPNIFDGNSIAELKAAIVAGQAEFRKYTDSAKNGNLVFVQPCF